MNAIAKLPLFRVKDSALVEAELCNLSSKHISDFETFWKQRLQNSSEEDSHWSWIDKFFKLSTPNYERLALECEAITQGLMILELDCYRSLLESTKNLVYVDYLTIAPWNRRSIENPPMYKGVGSSLLKLAIERSFDLDYKGRIGLHSLPGAENFYRKFGMVDLGYDSNKQGLRYFEISSDQAEKILSQSS